MAGARWRRSSSRTSRCPARSARSRTRSSRPAASSQSSAERGLERERPARRPRSGASELWTRQPLLGQGYGTNVVDPDAGGIEANIFDDQWLGTLLATGIVGFVGWVWFFVRAIRRFGREAKRDASERGWLLTAITAAIAAYGVGMLTFDAFAFIQVTFLMFILVGLGSVVDADGFRDAAPVAESVSLRHSARHAPRLTAPAAEPRAVTCLAYPLLGV